MVITYSSTIRITPQQFIAVLESSTLADRRPVTNLDKIERMVKNADLTITAWDGEKLIGIARSITDFAFCCYLSDLAVDLNYQRKGIGKRLIDETRKQVDPDIPLFLFAAPKAVEYYPKVGFKSKEAWIISESM